MAPNSIQEILPTKFVPVISVQELDDVLTPTLNNFPFSVPTNRFLKPIP